VVPRDQNVACANFGIRDEYFATSSARVPQLPVGGALYEQLRELRLARPSALTEAAPPAISVAKFPRRKSLAIFVASAFLGRAGRIRFNL